MKKTSTSIEGFLAAGLASLCLIACAFTDYGHRINQEQMALSRLEERRHRLETQYVIVLNHLEVHPADEKLLKERDAVRGKLQEVSTLIDQKRRIFDQSIMEWEQKIVQERIEKEMIEKEIRENQGKDEQIEFENK